jgi:hypothetical protein
MAGDGEANKSKHGAPITSRPTRFSGKQKVRHSTCRLTQIRKHYIRKKTQNRDAEIASRRAAAGVVRAISAVLGKHVDVYLRALRQASPMSLLLDFFPKKDITVKSIIISILSKQTQKVFAWLILKDRLSTRELPRRNVLCSQSTEESLFHLLIGCPFASACCNWLGLQILQQWDLSQCLESFRRQLHVPFFMEVIIRMSRAIWQARNGLIFSNKPPSFHEAKRTF